MNAKPFCGRPIAIDWAVPRDIYVKHQLESEIKAEEDKDFNELIGKSTDGDESEESEEEPLEDDNDEAEDDAEDDEAEQAEDDAEDDDESEGGDAKATQDKKPRGTRSSIKVAVVVAVLIG